MKKSILLLVVILGITEIALAQGPRRVAVGDWPEIRGPKRDGVSQETGLIERWTLAGENLLWRLPFGGRSAPIVMGNRVYLQNPSGRGAELQERVMALDADTGRVVWEYKFNIFQSDIPAHRVGWASPAESAVNIQAGLAALRDLFVQRGIEPSRIVIRSNPSCRN